MTIKNEILNIKTINYMSDYQLRGGNTMKYINYLKAGSGSYQNELEAFGYYKEGKISKLALEHLLNKETSGVEIIIEMDGNTGICFSVNSNDVKHIIMDTTKIIMSISDSLVKSLGDDDLRKIVVLIHAMASDARVEIKKFIKEYSDMNLDLDEVVDLCIKLSELYYRALDVEEDDTIEKLINTKVINDKYEVREAISSILEDKNLCQSEKIDQLKNKKMFDEKTIEMIEALLIKHNGAIIKPSIKEKGLETEGDNIVATITSNQETDTMIGDDWLDGVELQESVDTLLEDDDIEYLKAALTIHLCEDEVIDLTEDATAAIEALSGQMTGLMSMLEPIVGTVMGASNAVVAGAGTIATAAGAAVPAVTTVGVYFVSKIIHSIIKGRQDRKTIKVAKKFELKNKKLEKAMLELENDPKSQLKLINATIKKDKEAMKNINKIGKLVQEGKADSNTINELTKDTAQVLKSVSSDVQLTA